MSADNQQGSRSVCRIDPSETIRRAPFLQKILQAYLQGALHDGTYNHSHQTFRICQKELFWLETLKSILAYLGYKSWLYREGKKRNVYILETTAKFLDFSFDPVQLQSRKEKIAYLRGYFDAEGGLPQNIHTPLYIYYCQKDRIELKKVHKLLEDLDIKCGKLHNPSIKIDPHYWRFYILRSSHQRFMKLISSWHPRKYQIFCKRMKI